MSTTTGRLPKSRITELTKAFQKMGPVTIHCRDHGHHWTPFDAYWLPGRKFVDQRLRCSQCTTVRRRLIDQWGNVISSSYVYPDGYLVADFGRLTGPDRGQLRLAAVLDIGVKDGPADDA